MKGTDQSCVQKKKKCSLPFIYIDHWHYRIILLYIEPYNNLNIYPLSFHEYLFTKSKLSLIRHRLTLNCMGGPKCECQQQIQICIADDLSNFHNVGRWSHFRLFIEFQGSTMTCSAKTSIDWSHIPSIV